ncbi:MAG: amidinotransferase [Candidatus Marinimicrobia bacterium]|nr:amidinotransferase [Candidatus Neomarinimicrobiota bacterium]
MVDPIRKVLVKHPKDAYQNQTQIELQSQKLNYNGIPDLEQAQIDHGKLIALMQSSEIEIHYLPFDDSTSLDSVYTHDPCVVTNGGVILSNMGKKERHTEPQAMARYFESINVPILGQIKAPGILEGGDVIWINEHTVAVGEGYRSNAEGIRQFTELLGNLVDEVISVPLPHWTGSRDCLHLMSNISPIDHNLYLVYSRLLPVPFRQYLTHRKIELIDVPDEEYASMACNVLALAPGEVIMLEGNPITKKRLESNGVDVHTYNGSEVSIKGSGGPTCLTRPFWRSTE